MKNFILLSVITFVLCNIGEAFFFKTTIISKPKLQMADVEVTFPNNKKVKVASGSSFKEAAKKAGFSPNYGCEEGKCGSCELKLNGKQKVRPCTGKVPASTTPIKLDNL